MCPGGGPQVVAAHIMRSEGLSPDAAVEEVRGRRSCANPNPGFLHQLHLFHQLGCSVVPPPPPPPRARASAELPRIGQPFATCERHHPRGACSPVVPQDTSDPRYKEFVKSNQGTEDLPDPEDVPSPSEQAAGSSKVKNSAAMTPVIACTCALVIFCLFDRSSRLVVSERLWYHLTSGQLTHSHPSA